MTQFKHVVSSALLAAGVLLVFGGLSAALGFTLGGMMASVAAIATLLYAGGVWFGGDRLASDSSPESVFVFDRTLRVVCGTACGSQVSALFPERMRAEIESRCASALLGQPLHFACEQDGEVVGFDAAPVRAADGSVLYGILITGTAAPASAVAACIAT